MLASYHVLTDMLAISTEDMYVFIQIEKRLAMSRKVTLVKGKNNMIGISIGGGAPMCPVLYVVQVAHTPSHPHVHLHQ